MRIVEQMVGNFDLETVARSAVVTGQFDNFAYPIESEAGLQGQVALDLIRSAIVSMEGSGASSPVFTRLIPVEAIGRRVPSHLILSPANRGQVKRMVQACFSLDCMLKDVNKTGAIPEFLDELVRKESR